MRTSRLAGALALVLTGASLSCGSSGDGSSSKPLLGGAFNFRGPYPTPALVTYTDGAGERRQVLAYPGQVEVFVEPWLSAADAKAFLASRGGALVAQLPLFGYHLVTVAAGAEDAFIASLAGDPRVVLAQPSTVAQRADVVDLSALEGPNGELPTVPNLKAQVGSGVYLYVPDDFVNATLPCGSSAIPHGVATDYVASRNLSGTGQQVNVFASEDTGVHPNDIAAANAIALGDMTFNGTGSAVVNLSLQGAYEDAAGNALSAAQYHANERALLWDYAAQLDALAQTAPDAFARTVFVLSTGNGVGNTGQSGLDLTSDVQQLRADFPAVFPAGQGPHLIVVGGTQAGSSAVDTGFNYSTGAGDVVYAPARDVPVSATGCTADGTSFAAPAVSNLIAAALAAHPGATVGQVTRAFMTAYAAKGFSLPTASEIGVQLGGTCSYALGAAGQSVGAGGGSGSVSVTAPAGCPWSAVSNAAWISIQNAGAGSGKGTVAYVVEANATSAQRTGSITIADRTYTVTQAGGVGITGSWSGNLSMPGASYPGCVAQTVSFTLSLTEDAGGSVSGSTSNGRSITSGSRSGNAVTVTLSTMYGSRGPYVWTWNGADTLTGSMAYFCYDLATGALQSEGTETFSVTRQ